MPMVSRTRRVDTGGVRPPVSGGAGWSSGSILGLGSELGAPLLAAAMSAGIALKSAQRLGCHRVGGGRGLIGQ